MKEFTLKQTEVTNTLKVNIGEESFQIPLASSMTMKEAASVETQAGTYAFISRFIPRKVLENLRVDEYNQIVDAWLKESGVNNLGESRASQRQ